MSQGDTGDYRGVLEPACWVNLLSFSRLPIRSPASRFQLGEADNTSVNRRVKGWH
jgi:hypothetical protein